MFLRFSCILLPVYGQRLAFAMSDLIAAPRLLVPTPCILLDTHVVEFVGNDGVLASYIAVSVQSPNGVFEVSLNRIAFPTARDRAVALTEMSLNDGPDVEVMLQTIGSGGINKRLGYKVTFPPAEAAAAPAPTA